MKKKSVKFSYNENKNNNNLQRKISKGTKAPKIIIYRRETTTGTLRLVSQFNNNNNKNKKIIDSNNALTTGNCIYCYNFGFNYKDLLICVVGTATGLALKARARHLFSYNFASRSRFVTHYLSLAAWVSS